MQAADEDGILERQYDPRMRWRIMALDIADDGIFRLARRRDERVAVELYWDSVTGAASVVLRDEERGERVQLDCPAEVAFAVYHDPRRYAEARGVRLSPAA